MKILTLEARDFRTYEGVDWKFGSQIHISGDNGLGKSSVAEAITYAMYGCTIGGSPYTDHLLRKGAKEGYVEVTVAFGGDAFEIRRYIGKKKKVYIDGQEASQTDIDRIIGSKEQFLAVFAPSYFVSLDNKSARELLMKLVEVPSQKDVLAKMDKPFAELLQNINLFDPEEVAKDLRKEIKECEAAYNRAEGRTEELKARTGREVPEPRKFDVQALDALKARIQSGSNALVQELSTLKSEQANLRPQYEQLKTAIREIPKVKYQEGDECGTCGNLLHGQFLFFANHEQLSVAASIEQSNERIKSDMLALVERGKVVSARISELEASGDGENLTALKQQHADMEREWREVESHNAYANRIRMERIEDETALAKLEQELKDLEADQFRFTEEIKAIGQYRSTLAEMQIAQLKQHLNKVDIKLFDVVKSTGEIKPTFELLYDGREYKSLSYSEQIRVHLEIATLFNRVTEMDYPVFIDNSESITWFNWPEATQVFTARVEEGQELRVETRDEDAKGDVA